MKILRTAFLNVYPDFGGGEVYLERLANKLMPFLSDGSVVISPFRLDVGIEWIKIDCIKRELKIDIASQYLKLTKTINRIVKEKKIDIIILNGERAIYLAPFLCSSVIKIGVKHMLIENGNLLLKTLLFRYCLKKMSCLVAISQFHINQFKAALGKKYLKKLCLIYNAVDEKHFLPKKNSLQKETFTFFEAASLTSRKGQIDLIKAFGKVVKKHENARLVLAGSGDMQNEIETLIDAYSLRDKVVLTGFVKDVTSLLENCDVFVLPSYSEGLPLSILEAMSCSCPVIASNVAGIPEIVRDNENGYLINPGDIETLADRMIRCVENRNMCVKIGESSRKIIERDFTETQFVQKWVDLLSQVSLQKK